MRLLKKLHKWVGLLIGIQVLLWLLSGLMISLLDPAKVSGGQWSAEVKTEPKTLGPAILLEPAELPVGQLGEALGVDLTVWQDKPVYRIRRTDGETLVDAVDGSVIVIEKADAEQLARRDFSGNGEIISIEHGMAPDMETRGSKGDYWRFNFSDPANTSIYISAATGEILERRNSYWRLRDFFWMLHIMDYSGRENFNNVLVITVALIAIWLGISGFVLLFRSFNRYDFFFLNPSRIRREVLITLVDPLVSDPQQLRLRKGSNLFLSLATHDINLPSICGGGGECGKCRVRIEATDLPDADDAELGLVPKPLRELGYRLACQQKADRDMTLHLPEGTLSSGL